MPDTARPNAAPVRKPGVMRSVFILFLGVLPFINAANSPSFHAIRGVEVVRLMASGFCFGVGFASLMGIFVRPRQRPTSDAA